MNPEHKLNHYTTLIQNICSFTAKTLILNIELCEQTYILSSFSNKRTCYVILDIKYLHVNGHISIVSQHSITMKSVTTLE